MCNLQLFAVIAILVFPMCLFAGDIGTPDTVYFGDEGKAYGSNLGQFRVPVYVTTDQEIVICQVNMEYDQVTATPVFDSASFYGSIFEQGNYLEITGGLLIGQYVSDGLIPDSIQIAGAAAENTLPVGKYKLCDIWFSVGVVGQQLYVDSTWLPPNGEFTLAYAGEGYDVPQFVGGVLDIAQAPNAIELSAPESASIDPGELLMFSISVNGNYPPFSIDLVNFENVETGGSPQNAPVLSGSNPATFEWTPTPYEYSTNWKAYFVVTDDTDYQTPFEVDIFVTGSGNYVGVIGDTNCDGSVDIDDCVFLLNHIFNGGPAPQCP